MYGLLIEFNSREGISDQFCPNWESLQSMGISVRGFQGQSASQKAKAELNYHRKLQQN